MSGENNFYTEGNKNDFFDFLEMKTEKLVTAVYMITNFFSDKEPIKWKLRDVCLSMLSDASVLKDRTQAEQANLFMAMLSSVGETISLLEISHLSGFISEMNYTVLKREYLMMSEHISQREELKKTLNRVSLPEAFFEDQEYRELSDAVGKSRADLNRNTRSSRQFSPKERMQNGSPHLISPHTRRGISEIKDSMQTSAIGQNDFLNRNGHKDISTQKENDKNIGRVEKVKNKRCKVMLDMLKDKSDLTIKDITAKITDCSEKTIQRELVALVQKGVIKKTGERRWSRYSLN
ncbi:MAG: DeoR family transcriptional regulator [Candidatus Pacebacteria bacterium]|nr:DeoR family transcriptional regulator [Candidatus Paceibacterota bacterium]